VLKARPQAVSFPGANPRHAHEWKLWKEVKLPDGKIIIAGVIDSTSNFVEHPELVADRLVQYALAAGRENVIAGVDCGFGTFAGRVQQDRLDEARCARRRRAARRQAIVVKVRLYRESGIRIEAAGSWLALCFYGRRTLTRHRRRTLPIDHRRASVLVAAVALPAKQALKLAGLPLQILVFGDGDHDFVWSDHDTRAGAVRSAVAVAFANHPRARRGWSRRDDGAPAVLLGGRCR
jgi:hypothetical protein